MNTTPTETVYKISRPDGYGLNTVTNVRGDRHYHGTVRTRHGYVYVYSEKKHTLVSIIHDGYDVSRTVRRGYTPRGLVTLAARFAEEIYG